MDEVWTPEEVEEFLTDQEGWMCGAFHPEKSWRCTLPSGHEGDHR